MFDSIQAVLGYVVLLCAVLAFLPGFDIVIGIVGIAAAVQFLYNLIGEPEDPTHDFLTQAVEPLLATLPPAPDGWAPPQTA